MSDDPIKDLEDFNQQGLNVNPLPPSEVRRLGDRMRRRNAAFAAVGAAAAIAVIVTPLAVFAGGRDHAEPPVTNRSVSPSESPSGSVAAAIPDDFPIGAGLVETVEGQDTALLADQLTYCDQHPLGSVEPLDALSAELAAGESSETRTLLLFDDGRAATNAEQSLLDAVAACPTEDDTAGGIEHQVIPESADWPGRTIQSTWEGDAYPTARFVHVVRAGPALLLTSSYAAGPADLEQTRAGVAPLVAAMAQFGDAEPGKDPSASEPTNQPARTIEIPEGFPLADGLPDGRAEGGQPGLQGPNRTLEPLSFSACGSSLDEPPHVDQLRASWTNVEDYRDRQLTTFEDAAQAVTYVQRLTDFYRPCPEEDGGQAGYAILHEVTRTAVGGESWAVVTYYEFDGAPAVGLSVVHVIRLGRAVLIDTTSNEGGAGPDRSAQIQDQIQGQTDATVEVVSAMCVFTESGC